MYACPRSRNSDRFPGVNPRNACPAASPIGYASVSTIRPAILSPELPLWLPLGPLPEFPSDSPPGCSTTSVFPIRYRASSTVSAGSSARCSRRTRNVCPRESAASLSFQTPAPFVGVRNPSSPFPRGTLHEESREIPRFAPNDTFRESSRPPLRADIPLSPVKTRAHLTR